MSRIGAALVGLVMVEGWMLLVVLMLDAFRWMVR